LGRDAILLYLPPYARFLSDILLTVSLAIMFGLNAAVVFRQPAKETSETATNSDTSITTGTMKKEQALKFMKVLGNLSSNQLAGLLEIDMPNLGLGLEPLSFSLSHEYGKIRQVLVLAERAGSAKLRCYA
jgi:hypothetical protein